MLNFKLPIADPKTSCYYSIKPAVASDSLAPSSMDVTNPQDTADLASNFPPANFDQIPVLPTRVPVYRVTEPSESQVPFQYSSTFNNQSEDDNILSSSSNPCQSCGRFDPPSSSTDSLSMECGVDPYQLQQLLDPNTQYFIDSLFPQHISPYVSNSSPDSDNSYGDIYPEITVTGSSESHLMTSANEGTNLPFPNFDAYNPHHDNYCM